jgi:hypothetical protein
LSSRILGGAKTICDHQRPRLQTVEPRWNSLAFGLEIPGNVSMTLTTMDTASLANIKSKPGEIFSSMSVSKTPQAFICKLSQSDALS